MDTPAEKDALLSVTDLCVSYRSLVAVQGVSFELSEGDFLCIVGANGSGKSSLIKALLGIVRPSQGNVAFGVPRERVSYMPQRSTISNDFPATVREIVMTGRLGRRRIFPFYTAEDRESVDSALTLLDIEDLAGRRIGGLSGGQFQRVLLARALCGNPRLIILDEPDAGLDERSSSHLLETLVRLNRTEKLTIAMASHDMDTARRLANKIAVMNTGLDFLGTPDEWTVWTKCRFGERAIA